MNILIPILALITIWLAWRNWPTSNDICDHDWTAWKHQPDENHDHVHQPKELTRTCRKCNLTEYKGYESY